MCILEMQIMIFYSHVEEKKIKDGTVLELKVILKKSYNVGGVGRKGKIGRLGLTNTHYSI